MKKGNVHFTELKINILQQTKPGVDEMGQIEKGQKPKSNGKNSGPEAVLHLVGE